MKKVMSFIVIAVLMVMFIFGVVYAAAVPAEIHSQACKNVPLDSPARVVANENSVLNGCDDQPTH